VTTEDSVETQIEEALAGGVNTVTRIGRRVHRPTGPWTPAVHALLGHLADAGFSGAPRVHGLDDQGREILDYIDGWVGDPLPEDARGDDAVRAVGRLLRGLHDATVEFVAPPDAAWYFPAREPAEVICHGDTANYNIAFRGGEPVAFIDFDTAHPGPRVWDVAYTAYRFAPMTDPEGPDPDGEAFTLPLTDQVRRLRILADGYGLSPVDRRALPDVAVERLRHLIAHMREQAAGGSAAFASHIAQGHDAHYLTGIEYITRHRSAYLAALE
jgi:hypothetical protein